MIEPVIRESTSDEVIAPSEVHSASLGMSGDASSPIRRTKGWSPGDQNISGRLWSKPVNLEEHFGHRSQETDRQEFGILSELKAQSSRMIKHYEVKIGKYEEMIHVSDDYIDYIRGKGSKLNLIDVAFSKSVIYQRSNSAKKIGLIE
ncbi:hypothetical protein HED55_19640 [Ochrobactrum haematophilum]|uniref:Uncharacterized protein n=1 Tax=Brucella haematophila TaxID=419474 RepID=A0ABX1DQ98_9HYPH|nr:hypothetical protein [Brucella haematophila]